MYYPINHVITPFPVDARVMMAKSLIPKYLDEISYSGAQASTLKRLGEYRGRQELFRVQA